MNPQDLATPEADLDRPHAPPAPRRVKVPIRVGLVGAGRMGLQHLRALAEIRTPVTVVAVADPSAAAVDALLARTPKAKGYESVERMLAEGELDAVHIVTPPNTHERLAHAAIEAGCHVYVEKPIAETEAAVRQLFSHAETRGVLLCPGHQLLFEAPSREACRLLPALGRIVHIESYFSFRPMRRSPDGRVPLRADLQLLDILPHPVYLLTHFLELAANGGNPVVTEFQIGRGGTIHALVRQGEVLGSLFVTLTGRPVESYLRVVGSNGTVQADFVRGTMVRLVGPGSSGIDKLLAPYRTAWQLVTGTTTAMSRRLLQRGRSYPGLAAIFGAFYGAIADSGPPPVSRLGTVTTVAICEEAARIIAERSEAEGSVRARRATGKQVVVTGATGFLGRALVETLTDHGHTVVGLARREPAPWDRVGGAVYVATDLSGTPRPELLAGAEAVVHCAAETVGAWEQHQRNSIDVTESLLRACASSGVQRFIHVSSVAVLSSVTGRPLSESSPLEADPRRLGPYVWGKLESERVAVALGAELGIAVRVVRPGAIVDYREFEPPGRLGRRVGGIFVAVGSPSQQLGVVSLGFACETLAWMVAHFEEAPGIVNLLEPELPSKRHLIEHLRRTNPDLIVAWLPTALLVPLSWCAVAAQRLLRPKHVPISLARVFDPQRYDTSGIAALAARMAASHDAGRDPNW